LIFVTVGTHHDPFQRLLDGLTKLDPDELVVQCGPGNPPAGVARAEAYLPFDEILALFREADKVITHAGVGSILCATREGHVPLVVPRRHDLGEHVDDHQSELTRALADRGGVVAVWEIDELPDLVAAAPSRQAPESRPVPSLCGPLNEALRGLAPNQLASSS
jgi:UDP-N-acetylglucosamine--N-acetylmuramyl-(pentapeptide) pyrophosphoryl-undecaprenol N-acetylglucosamine transferase